MNDHTNTTTSDASSELQPCHHMVDLVSRRSDGSLSGPAKWYTDFHVLTCPQCRHALQGLRQLRSEVAELAASPAPEGLRLDEGEWRRIESSLKE